MTKQKRKRITEIPREVDMQWLIGTLFMLLLLAIGAMSKIDKQLIFNVAVAYHIAFQIIYIWWMDKHYIFEDTES